MFIVKFIKKLIVIPISLTFFVVTMIVWLIPLPWFVRFANWGDQSSNRLMVWAMKEKKNFSDLSRQQRRALVKRPKKQSRKGRKR